MIAFQFMHMFPDSAENVVRALPPWIGEDRLKIMSYELATLLHELDAAPIRFHTVLSDIWRICFGFATN
jgi:hypothetical protein